MEKPQLNGNRLKWFAFAVALSFGGLMIVSEFLSGDSVLVIFRHLFPGYLALAVLLTVLLWVVEGLRLQVLLKTMDESLGLGQLISINLATAFMAGITPLAAGGPPAQAYFLYKKGIDLEKCLSVAAVRQLLNFVFFVLAIPFSILFFYRYLEFTGWMSIVIILALLLMIIGIGAFLFFVCRPNLLGKFTLALVSLRLLKSLVQDPLALADKVALEVEKFHCCLRLLLFTPRKGLLFLIGLYTIIFWAGFFGLAPLLLKGLGLEVPLALTMVRQLVYYFVVMYVPLPGGSGIAELGFATIFATLVPKVWLAGFVAGWRMLTYYINLIIGGLALLHQNRGETTV